MATILPNGKTQFLDGSGKPLANGTVGFYIPSTLTPKNTWQDQAQTILNANPVTLDGNGEAIIFGSGSYRQIVKDSLSNTIWDTPTVDASSASGALLIANNLSDVASPSTSLSNLGGVNSSYVASQLAVLVPSGSIIMWGANSAPSGWLECNGAAVSRATYSVLFGIIGTNFGSGDGSTTFNLPDFRGYAPRGWDHSAGVDSGRTFGSIQGDQMVLHNHSATVTDPTHNHIDDVATSSFVCSGSGANFALTSVGSTTHNASTGISVSIGNAGAGSETRMKNIAVMFVIKT